LPKLDRQSSSQQEIEKQALKLSQISTRLLLYMVAMCSFTLVEGLIGMLTKNVHVLRDFFSVLLLIVALCFSTRAIDNWNES